MRLHVGRIERTLPGDMLVECKGTPSHTTPWYGQVKCHCGADLPIKARRPQPPPEEPTGRYLRLNEALDCARRAPAAWRFSATGFIDGYPTRILWEGDNSRDAWQRHQGKPYRVQIGASEERFASRHQAFAWFEQHVLLANLWPWWLFQQE